MSDNNITFYKYQGTGNDFIIITDRYRFDTKTIVALCDRKFGIGADGLIVMKKESNLDFDMMYYNADGTESFCGNGSRCAVQHAHFLGWIGNRCSFNSNDGPHEAEIDDAIVHLKMHDVEHVASNGKDYITNTGSPHYIVFTSDLESDIVAKAQAIRYSPDFKEKGINVNFIRPEANCLAIRTYERGVEDETLSCGTGVTAAVIAEYVRNEDQRTAYAREVRTEGGSLAVRFKHSSQGFTDIYLIGPAIQVFRGEISL